MATIKTLTELQNHLKEIRACNEAREWAGDRTPQQAWDECPRADWLLWWAAKTQVNAHEQIVLAACACARSVLHLVRTGEMRPLHAIETAEHWASDPTPENKKLACHAAAAVAVCAAACDAACAAAYDAAAACAAADAAYDAACDAACAAAYDAVCADARTAKHTELCIMIRAMLACPFVK